MTVGVLISPAKVEQVKFDALSMHVQPQVAAQQKMVDDGSGEVQVSEGQGRTRWWEVGGGTRSGPHTGLILVPGMAHRGLRAGACGVQVAGPFLRWRLLPAALHLPYRREATLLVVYLAGEVLPAPPAAPVLSPLPLLSSRLEVDTPSSFSHWVGFSAETAPFGFPHSWLVSFGPESLL